MSFAEIEKSHDFRCKSKNEDDIRNHWFPDHVIEEDGDWLLWRKPGTGIYMVRYHIYMNRLIVTGDIGSAVYIWSQNIDWDFVGNCSIDYFASKCEASEYGRGGKKWDWEHAVEQIIYTLQDYPTEYTEAPSDEFIEEAEGAAHYEEEWHQFLATEEAEKYFGEDWEFASIGMNVDIRIEGHLVGLKMMKEIRDRQDG